MPFDAPFRLGPFSVGPEGQLSPCDPAAAPAFLFRWRDRVVRARLGLASAETWRLTLQMNLARVCSTASTPDETLRPRTFALLHWLGNMVPHDWRVGLSADHRVWLEVDTAIRLPITAAGLITKLTSFVLDLTPYLVLLEETGMTLSRNDANLPERLAG